MTEDHHPRSVLKVEKHAAAICSRLSIRGAKQSPPRSHHPSRFCSLLCYLPDEDSYNRPLLRFPSPQKAYSPSVDRFDHYRAGCGISGAEQQIRHRESEHHRTEPASRLPLHRDLLSDERFCGRFLRNGAEGKEEKQHLDSEHSALSGDLLLLLSECSHDGSASNSIRGILCGLQ